MRSISAFFMRLMKIEAHDPMNWRKSDTASQWYTMTYCSNCKAQTHHADIMSGICHTCGSNKGVKRFRSSRYLWNGKKWVIQHKYGDGPNDYEIEE